MIVETFLAGKRIRLEPAAAIGKGGEADVYDLGDGRALKVFKTPDHPDYEGFPEQQRAAEARIALHQRKLPDYPKGLPRDVMVPQELATDARGARIVGFTMPTPVSDGTRLYVVNDKGIVWALDAKTGAEVYGPVRLKPGTYSASPVLADGRIYVTNEDGLTSVFKAGPKFELLAENALDSYTLSSPAVSDGQIFLRTESHLYAIGQRVVKK